MKSIVKYFKCILICFIAATMFGCFIFALLFGIAGIGAINQVNIVELAVLFSFCYLFSLAGNSFLTITTQLYESIRR